MLKFTENFSMTFAENRTYGVPEFAGTEVNRHSGKLKGLLGYGMETVSRVVAVAAASQHHSSSSSKQSTTAMY